MNICIVDDNKEVLNQIEKLVKEVFPKYNKILLAESYKEFYELFNTINFDLIFLDIKLKDMNSIDIMKENIHQLRGAKVVYITGYDFAEAIFETNPFYYLKKPITKNKIEKVYKKLQQNDKSIIIKFDKVIKKILINDIIFIDSYARVINFHLTNNETIKTYNKLSIIQEMLPNNFVRIHKSYIVNLDKVKQYKKYEIILENDLKLTISRNCANEVKQKFLNYVRTSDIYE